MFGAVSMASLPIRTNVQLHRLFLQERLAEDVAPSSNTWS